MCEKLSKEEFVEEMKKSRAVPDPEAKAAKDEARKAKRREYNRRYAEKKKAEKAEAAGSLTIPAEAMERIRAASNTIQSEPSCVLTKDEAYAVAEFIEVNIFDAIRNDAEWDSAYVLLNLMHVLEKAVKVSGYKGMTIQGGEQDER